jgi:hypothetical protein
LGWLITVGIPLKLTQKHYRIAALPGIVTCILVMYWYRSKTAVSTKSFASAEMTSVTLDPPRLAIGKGSASPASPPPDLRVVNDISSLALDEQSLKQKIRDSLANNPKLAEALAREGRERFPGDTSESDQRDALLVMAVYNQGKIDLASREADYYLEHHPNGRYREKLILLSTHR